MNAKITRSLGDEESISVEFEITRDKDIITASNLDRLEEAIHALLITIDSAPPEDVMEKRLREVKTILVDDPRGEECGNT